MKKYFRMDLLFWNVYIVIEMVVKRYVYILTFIILDDF